MKLVRLLAALALALALVLPPSAALAGLDIDININLAPIKMKAEPEVVPIFGTLVYLMLGAPKDEDVLFLGGFWYRQKGGQWYRSEKVKSEKWERVPPGHVPKEIRGLPSGYGKVEDDQPRIKEGELRQSWQKWEKEKRWEKRERAEKKEGPDAKDVKDAYDKGKDAKDVSDKMKGKDKKKKLPF